MCLSVITPETYNLSVYTHRLFWEVAPPLAEAGDSCCLVINILNTTYFMIVYYFPPPCENTREKKKDKQKKEQHKGCSHNQAQRVRNA